MNVEVVSRTDPGRVRPANEDCHAWWIPSDEQEKGRRGVLLVVADGMGGAQAGEQASRRAVAAVIDTYSRSPGQDPLEELAEAVREANRTVFQTAAETPAWKGMGTTCTAVVIRERDLLIAQVGDSRAYLATRVGIRRLTRDHSLVAELVEHGQITAAQARVHPHRNVVTRAVGVAAQVQVETHQWDGVFTPDATVLLCSDGLHGVLEDQEILRLAGEPSLEWAAQALVEEANAMGGPDNITVLMARAG
jgi:PPM family protein phosphatase